MYVRTYVSVRARQRKQADRVGESQHVCRAFMTQLAVFSNPAKKSKSAGAKKNYDQPQAAGGDDA